MMSSIKGPSTSQFDGSSLRVAIVHARWNKVVIEALIAGAIAKLIESGVKDTNIVVLSVPGSYELPLACSKCVVLHSTTLYNERWVESLQVPAYSQARPVPICSASVPFPTTPLRVPSCLQLRLMQSSPSVFSSRVQPCTLSTFVTVCLMVS